MLVLFQLVEEFLRLADYLRMSVTRVFVDSGPGFSEPLEDGTRLLARLEKALFLACGTGGIGSHG